MPRTRRLLRGAFLAGLLLAAAAAGLRAAIDAGWFRAPFPGPGVALAWALRTPERAYNFEAVEPGRLYRSGLPDERFLRHAVRRYGVRRLVGLSGPDPVHERAAQLGLEVRVFSWAASRFPPRAELEEVLALLAAPGPTWLHCGSGADRTGYAVAAHRLRGEGWPLGRVRAEMARFGHRAERHPAPQAALAAFARAPREARVAPRSGTAVR